MTFLLYLCKVALCSGILLGYYWFFLRNKQFHRYNRFYLLGAMMASVVLPFFKIKIWHQPQNPVNQVVYQTVDVLTVGYGETDGHLQANNLSADLFTVDQLLYIVYAAGALALLVLLAKSLLYIRRIARQYPHEVIDQLKFYTTSEPGTPFSFFHSIFWNDQLKFNSKEGQQIFRHELFHIRQRHSNDVLLAELITALFWCNPFFHIIKKELKAIHEFLADQYAVSGSDRYAYAELLVMQTLHTPHIPVTHRFFQNHIKRRIAMITHLNARNYNYWSRLMVLPVAVLLFCSFAMYAQQPETAMATSHTAFENAATRKVFNVVIDAGHGGSDPGASSPNGQVKEKDIALQISLKIQQLAPAYHVNIIMTRADNELPTHATVKEDGLRARTTIAQQNKAAAFISIHMAATENNDNTRNGLEVYIARENEKWLSPSKELGTAVLQSVSTLYTTNPALLQRKQKGIWVLDHSPCPAILIECGYITNEKDLAYFSNSTNQEALAKKILEGIVNYQKQPGVSTTDEKSSVSQTTQTGKTAAPVFSHPPVVNQDTSKDPVTPEMLEAINILNNSKIVEKLSRFFNRNVRYVHKAFENNAEGSVYFSIDVTTKGDVENFKLYQETPAAKKINELVTIGYPSTPSNGAAALPAEESRQIFSDEVERVIKKMPPVTDVAIKEKTTFYFKASFRLERPKP